MIKKIISKVGAKNKQNNKKPETNKSEKKSDSHMMKNYMLSGGIPPRC